MSKEAFEACNVRAVPPTTCSISHLATLNFIQHFNNPVTQSQDPSAPFHRLIHGWMFWIILHNQHTLGARAPNCSEGVDWWGRWPQMLATHVSQLPPALATSFQAGEGGLPCPQAVLWKVLPACFFPKFHCFSLWGGSGELLAAQLPVHSFHAGAHLSLACGLLPFMSQTCSQVLMLQFSVVASSYCCRKICLATPQSSSDSKTSTWLFIHGLKLP